jgi:hypothetical protein
VFFVIVYSFATRKKKAVADGPDGGNGALDDPQNGQEAAQPAAAAQDQSAAAQATDNAAGTSGEVK